MLFSLVRHQRKHHGGPTYDVVGGFLKTAQNKRRKSEFSIIRKRPFRVAHLFTELTENELYYKMHCCLDME